MSELPSTTPASDAAPALLPPVGSATGGVDRTGPSPAPGAQHAPGRSWRYLRVSGVVVAIVQFGVLLAISLLFYGRFNLGIDFAIFNQAWTEIGRGHLDPFTTLQGLPFYTLNFDLLMWPLALVHLVVSSAAVLLWVQDLALAGTGLVCFLWIVDMLERRRMGRAGVSVLALLALALWVANPATYAVANQDFHTEPIGALFAVLAARDLWGGRFRRAWWWIGGCLLCGDNGGLYVLGIGLSCVLAGRATRRRGWLLLAVGLAWMVLIDVAGANVASRGGYAWLAGRSVLPDGFAGAFALLGGVVEHPSRPLQMVFEKRISALYGWLRPGGVIGLVNPWGFGVPAVVLLAAALQQNPIFLNVQFQSYVVYAFVLFGTCAIVSSVLSFTRGRRFLRARYLRPAAAVGSIALVIGCAFVAAEGYPGIFSGHAIVGEVAPGAASALGQTLAETPRTAEVVVPTVIAGRFGSRRFVDLYAAAGEGFAVDSRQIVVVLSASYGAPISAAEAWSAGRQLRRDGARTLVDRDGIWALIWRPPAGTTSFHLG